MRTNKLRVLLAVSFLAGVLAAWLAPDDRFLRFIPFVVFAGSALTFGMFVLVSRIERTDVTSAEKMARRMFFKKSPPNGDSPRRTTP